MVNPYRVQTNLVHHGDTGLLALLVELHHGRGDIGGGDNVLLGADGRFDDQGVEGVRDQGDGQVNLLHDLVQGGVIVDIEGNSLGVLEAFAQLPGAFESPAG